MSLRSLCMGALPLWRGRVALMTLVTGLLACAALPVPDWQVASARAVEQGVDAYLSGLDNVAQVEFSRAQREARRSADPEVVARTYLAACAAHVAALDWAACGHEPGLADATAETQAYARYLMGQAQAADLPLLPETQRTVATRALGQHASAVAKLDQAWSRLVAVGVLWRQGVRDPALAQLAVDTASAQGWSRAVGVWLQAQQALFEQTGQLEAAQRVQRRLDLLLKPPAAATPPN